MLTAEQAAVRYQQGTSSPNAKQKYIDGINSVTESPMEKAASPAATQLYLNRVQESVSSGRRQQRLRETSISSWKDAATKKGADRLASGAAAAMNKVRAHFQKWMPIYAEAKAAAAAIQKDGTTATAVQKVQAAIDVMKRAAGKA